MYMYVYMYVYISLVHVLLLSFTTVFSKLTLDHSRWQVSRVKQGTLTLPEHLFPHLIQKCFILWVFTGYTKLTIVCFLRLIALITDSDKSAGTFIIIYDIKRKKLSSIQN